MHALAPTTVPADRPAPTGAEDALVPLIRAVAGGDRRAFEALYHRLAPAIGRYVQRLLLRRDLVDEVVNDVMLGIWRGAARYDPAAGRPTTWAIGIAHHQAIKVWARLRRHAHEDSFDDDTSVAAVQAAAASADGGPERELQGRQLGRGIECALAGLSVEHRAVIELAFGEQRSYAEIAAITGCPVNTVKTRVFNARQRLAGLLADAGWPQE